MAVAIVVNSDNNVFDLVVELMLFNKRGVCEDF